MSTLTRRAWLLGCGGAMVGLPEASATTKVTATVLRVGQSLLDSPPSRASILLGAALGG